jgi:hypothetical protein
MAGWREIREAFTDLLRAIDPAIAPDIRWAAADRAQPPAAWHGSDRAFTWMMVGAGLPKRDLELDSPCSPHFVAEPQLWIRYSDRADKNLLQDMIAEDQAQVSIALTRGAWPAHLYEVQFEEDAEVEEIFAVSPPGDLNQQAQPRRLGLLVKVPVQIKFERTEE